MRIEEKTISLMFDDEKCSACKSHACVEACKLYARGILTLLDGRPALAGDAGLGKLRGTECLACEYECWFRGEGGLTIEAPVAGLEEYRRRHGVP